MGFSSNFQNVEIGSQGLISTEAGNYLPLHLSLPLSCGFPLAQPPIFPLQRRSHLASSFHYLPCTNCSIQKRVFPWTLGATWEFPVLCKHKQREEQENARLNWRLFAVPSSILRWSNAARGPSRVVSCSSVRRFIYTVLHASYICPL